MVGRVQLIGGSRQTMKRALGVGWGGGLARRESLARVNVQGQPTKSEPRQWGPGNRHTSKHASVLLRAGGFASALNEPKDSYAYQPQDSATLSIPHPAAGWILTVPLRVSLPVYFFVSPSHMLPWQANSTSTITRARI